MLLNHPKTSINEVYFGKQKEIIRIEKQLDIFRNKYIDKNFSKKNIKVNSDVDLLKFNRMIEDFFGFGCFSLSIINNPTINVCTTPIDYRFDVINTRKNLIADRNTFKFNKDAGYACIVFINSGLIFNSEFTTEEMLAIILHEIGHNFFAALDKKHGVMANLLSAIVFISQMINICNKINNDFVDYDSVMAPIKMTNIYRSISIKLQKWLRENNSILMTLDDLLTYGANIIKYAKQIIPGILNIISLGTLNILAASLSVIKKATNPFTYIIMPIGYQNERLADNFPTMYGYGPAFISGMEKMSRMVSYGSVGVQRTIDKIPILSNIYIINMNIADILIHAFDEHPIAISRAADQLYMLEIEVQKNDLDPKMKQILLSDIKICKKNLNKMIDTSEGLKNKHIVRNVYYKYLYDNTDSKQLKDMLLDDFRKFNIYDKTYNEKLNK